MLFLITEDPAPVLSSGPDLVWGGIAILIAAGVATLIVLAVRSSRRS